MIDSLARKSWIAFTVCWLVVPAASAGQDILEYLPEDALGFVLVHNLSNANVECEELARLLDIDALAPLALLKMVTGLGEGLNLEGDCLVALLPGAHGSGPAEPLVVLPVGDYTKFAASINADETGEVCRVAVAGEDVLVGQHGAYAMLMNVEHRETLEIIVGLEPSPVELLEPWSPWLNANQVTLAVLPAGVAKLLKLGRENLVRQGQQWQQEFGDPEFSDVLSQMQQSLNTYQTLLDICGLHLNAAAVGVSLSDAQDMRVGLRLLTHEQVQMVEPASVPASTLTGYPDRPYVIAGGGPTPPQLMRTLVSASVLMMKYTPEAYGYESFGTDDWQALEESYLAVTEGLRSATFFMEPGEKGDPLFGNVRGTLQTESASGYLQAYKGAIETWNRLTLESSSDIKMQYEVSEIKVGGADACEVVVDVAAAARDPNVPMFNWMLDSMFGPEGKLRMLLVAVDNATLIGGLATVEQMSTVMEEVRHQEKGLENSPDIQATDRLFEPSAAWKFYVSPRGCVVWCQRITDELFRITGQAAEQLPEFPTGPPVGVSLRLHETQAEVDIVGPAATLNSFSEFIRACKER